MITAVRYDFLNCLGRITVVPVEEEVRETDDNFSRFTDEDNYRTTD